jgi:hypothetical protein
MPNLLMSDQQLTVQQLLDYLQQLVKKDPSMKDAKVCHSEFGAVTPTHAIYTDTKYDPLDENKKDTILVIYGN